MAAAHEEVAHEQAAGELLYVSRGLGRLLTMARAVFAPVERRVRERGGLQTAN
jgi:hypothetical protein